MQKIKSIENFLYTQTNNSQINRLAFQYADGGMEEAGFKKAGDCVVRAICNATNLSYRKVLDDLNKLTEEYRLNSNSRLAKKMKPKQNVRRGAYKKVYHDYILSLGWEWKPTMQIGQGCTNHLRRGELPNNSTMIVRVSKHLTCVINDCIYDTYDCSREGTRCVYGYYIKQNTIN